MMACNKETFYKILCVSTDATTDEIKKSYKQLALKHHPDKNLGNIAECTKRFAIIKEAYGVLSDPKQRDWYDRHKEVFHREESPVVEHIIEDTYFTCHCYKGFDDFATGFYTVYRELFDQIIEQELPFQNDLAYPRFGNSVTDLEEVKHFYDHWQSFSTSFTFVHLEKHDIRQAPNRRVVRLMQKENRKVCEEARKHRNAHIQSLVAFVRKKDQRMERYKEQLQARVEENRQKSEQHRRKVIQERERAFADYVANQGGGGWNDVEELEQQLQNMEVNLEDRKVPANQVADGDQGAGDEEEEELDELYFCAACNRKFKTINAFRNHEKSKKHLSALEQYRDGDEEVDTD